MIGVLETPFVPLRGEERIFRIDRIEELERTGVTDPPRTVNAPSGDDWFVGDDLPVATVVLGPQAAWVMERYPLRSRETRADGTVEVGLTVADETWLDSLLLRLGTRAQVTAPAQWTSRGADVAAALLERYERTEP